MYDRDGEWWAGQGREGQGGERGQGAKSEGCRWVVRVSVRLCPVPFTLPLPISLSSPLPFPSLPSFLVFSLMCGEVKGTKESKEG